MMNLQNIVSEIYEGKYFLVVLFLTVEKYDTESVHNCLIINFDDIKWLKCFLAKYMWVNRYLIELNRSRSFIFFTATQL